MSLGLVIPQDYDSKLNIRDTEIAIKLIKDYFETELAKTLHLTRVSAPLFVLPNTGLNDNLNGIERPVMFEVLGLCNKQAEIVHSLAKWKRFALKRYGFYVGEGLYTDMNAIRRDEEFDNIHSIYVDQWDWESIINKQSRNMDTLINYVKDIYAVLKSTESFICSKCPLLTKQLPEKICIITSQELEDLYPRLSPKEREKEITKRYGAVFLMQIGGVLNSGEPHDGRAPDYDDWNLNGDILLYNSLLDISFEISSMGIRVDSETLINQLKIRNCEEKLSMDYHKALLNGELPYTIGGGIGQSRLCMYFLQKAHIGEVHASIWPEETINTCYKNNIYLL